MTLSTLDLVLLGLLLREPILTLVKELVSTATGITTDVVDLSVGAVNKTKETVGKLVK